MIYNFLKKILKSPPQPIPVDPQPETTAALIESIRSKNLSYCGAPKLENLAEACALIREGKVPGYYLEAGVALGGSAILLGRSKPTKTKLELYDVFETIPAPGGNDGPDSHLRYKEICSGKSKGLGGDLYYGYLTHLMDVVTHNLAQFGLSPQKHNISLIKGLFEDTLHPTEPVALAHIDCDWYDSVKVCIDRIMPRMSKGGIIIFDDYASYSGCRKAVDEWLARDHRFSIIFNRRSIGIRKIN